MAARNILDKRRAMQRSEAEMREQQKGQWWLKPMTQGRVVEGVYRRAETMVKLLGFILNAKRNYWRILNKRVA